MPSIVGGRPMARIMAFMSALALVMAALFSGTASADLHLEENALLLFKEALQDSRALESWLPQLSSSTRSGSACSGSWRGVGCNPTLDAVVALTMEGGDFSGPIPDEIGSLTFLKGLTIRKTKFMGAIPKTIAELRSLQHLVLSNNPELSGPFPQWTLALPHLEILNLSGNNLTGTLPGCNSTTVTVVGPVGSVTVTVPIPVLMPFVASVNITVPLVALPIPVIQNISSPNFTNVNPPVWAFPPYPLDNPPLNITPTMNWAFPHLNSTLPPDTLPPLPAVNLSYPTLPPLQSDNPEFPGFPLQRAAPNFTTPKLTIPNITKPLTPTITFPPIPSVALPPIPSVALPPIPNVTFPLNPNISFHPIPSITLPPIPNVTHSPIPNVRVPLNPNIRFHPIPSVTLPSIPNLAIFPPIPSISLPNFTMPSFPPFPQIMPPNLTISPLPQFPFLNITIPNLPSISPLPSLPQIPNVPPLPSIEGLPPLSTSIPPFSSVFEILPIPQIMIHNLTSIPPLPDFPVLPPLPEIVIPNLTIPPIPSLPPLPIIPSFSPLPIIPNLPPMPTLSPLPTISSLPPLPTNASIPPLPTIPDLPPIPMIPILSPLPTIPSLPPIINDLPQLPNLSPISNVPNVPPLSSHSPSLPSVFNLPPLSNPPPFLDFMHPNFTFPTFPPLPKFEPNLTFPKLPPFLPQNLSLPNIPSIGLPLFNLSFPILTIKPPLGSPPCNDAIVGKPKETIASARHLTESTLILRNNISKEPTFNNLPNLQILDLSNNAFFGHLPKDLHTLPNLKHLDLSNNELTGSISSMLLKSKVKSINLANNLFCGRLPHLLVAKFDLLDVSNNCLTGIVPKKDGKISSRFTFAQKCSQKSRHCKCRKIKGSQSGRRNRHSGIQA